MYTQIYNYQGFLEKPGGPGTHPPTHLWGGGNSKNVSVLGRGTVKHHAVSGQDDRFGPSSVNDRLSSPRQDSKVSVLTIVQWCAVRASQENHKRRTQLRNFSSQPP